MGLAMLAGIAAVAFAQGVIPGQDGCVLRSVDKRAYLAGNDAVFRTIPLPRWFRKAHANTWVHGIPAQHACAPWHDTGPPYGAYVTTYVYLQRPGQLPIGFDERILHGQWVRQPAGTPTEANFRRALALLRVSTSTEGVLLSIDYRAFARRGH